LTVALSESMNSFFMVFSRVVKLQVEKEGGCYRFKGSRPARLG